MSPFHIPSTCPHLISLHPTFPHPMSPIPHPQPMFPHHVPSVSPSRILIPCPLRVPIPCPHPLSPPISLSHVPITYPHPMSPTPHPHPVSSPGVSLRRGGVPVPEPSVPSSRPIRYFLALKSSTGKSSCVAANASILFFTEPRTCGRSRGHGRGWDPHLGPTWGPMRTPCRYLQQGLDAGLENHVGVEQEGAEQGLGVAGKLGHEPREQHVHVQRVVRHVLQLGQQRRHEGTCAGSGGSAGTGTRSHQHHREAGGTSQAVGRPHVKGWPGAAMWPV